MVSLTVSVDEGVRARLDVLAAEQERSVGALVRLALKEFLTSSGSREQVFVPSPVPPRLTPSQKATGPLPATKIENVPTVGPLLGVTPTAVVGRVPKEKLIEGLREAIAVKEGKVFDPKCLGLAAHQSGRPCRFCKGERWDR